MYVFMAVSKPKVVIILLLIDAGEASLEYCV